MKKTKEKTSKQSKYPSVEVIILHMNNEKLIDSCLSSLKKTKYPNLRVTVVDQASSDNSVKLIKNKHPWVNLIENKKNLSFAKGNNNILKSSKAKYCILLNNDTEHEPNWVSELVKIAEKEKNVAALQPKILSLTNKNMFEYAGAAGGFIDIYGYPLCRGRLFDNIEQDTGQYDDTRELFWSCGVAMFLNMDVIKKIGYLDEIIGAYAEELDLCWRMNLSGYRQLFVPSSVIYHLGSGTWKRKKFQFKKFYLLHRNHSIILFKNYSPKKLLKILPVKVLLELIAFAGFLFKEPKRSLAIALANLWIFTHSATLLKMNKHISKLRKLSDNQIMDKMIRRSIALDALVFKKANSFTDFIPFIRNY